MHQLALSKIGVKLNYQTSISTSQEHNKQGGIDKKSVTHRNRKMKGFIQNPSVRGRTPATSKFCEIC